jgi:hypothetical protein
MTYKDICQMNHEIGVIQGIALGTENAVIADNLFTAAEILEEIAEKLMQEVMGNERISQD